MKMWEQQKNYKKFLELLKAKSNKKQRNCIMSMELHTLRAVKITQNIFELNRLNTELQHLKVCVKVLENRKTELESSLTH